MFAKTKPYIRFAVVAFVSATPLTVSAGASVTPEVVTDTQDTTGAATRVEPKKLSPATKRGLEWLVEHQLSNGGWGQGEESRNMGGEAPTPNAPMSPTPASRPSR
jgi:hypothetical protein